MPLLLYLVVLLISVSSVVFGLGWVSALESHYQVSPVQMSSQLRVKPTSYQTEAAATPASSIASPACDIQACKAAYYSFRTSDCTYQPYHGPRRICDKGTPRAPSRASAFDAQELAARAQAPRCNLKACDAAYKSFNPTDCTYQPYHGPRRICAKGTPPAQAQKMPAAASAFGAQALAARAQASTCNIAACKVAYRTFDPTDCTYQPSEGPRRFCAK